VLNPGNAIFIPPEPYLTAKGHSVERIPVSAVYKDLDQRLDCALVWTAADTQPEVFDPLHKVLQRPRDNDGEGGSEEPPFLPIMAFVQPDAAMAVAPEGLKEVSAMHQAFDLRQLDANLQRACSGERVALPSPPSGEGPAAEAALGTHAPEDPAELEPTSPGPVETP